MSGTLHVVGVGPGDPDLITLKAARVIESAAVVAYPQTTTGSLAARIAAAHIGTAEQAPFTVPMSNDGAAEAAYDAAAAMIEAHCAAGRDVALLCEGDPMLYGSAASVTARLAGRVSIAIVPGVAAATACAAAAGASLVRGEAPLTILPSTADADILRRALASPGAVVLYKVGRHFDAVRALVEEAGRTGTLVIRATTEDERVMPLADAPAGIKPYFSTILVTDPPAPRPAPSGDVAVVVLAPGALETARRAKAALAAEGRAVTLHGLAARVAPEEVDVSFASATHHIGRLFAGGTSVVGVCAAGILIRSAAPFVRDKTTEPPLVALAEDGSAVVPLLGAHHGGGRIAATLGATFAVAPAATTLSDTRLGIALDDPPEGYTVADIAPFKALARTLASGDGVDTAAPFLADLPRGPHKVAVTSRLAEDAATVPTYIARTVALGMGAERGADPAAAVRLARTMLAAAGIDPRAVAAVVTLDLKADETALHAVAADLGAPLRVFTRERLAQEDARLATPSDVVRAAVGIGGVAEAAALAAAGPDGILVSPKVIGDGLTVALAEAPAPIGPVGRARGKLTVVGIGPGTTLWRTGDCVAALARADAFVGYTLYLDLVEDLRAHQTRHDFPLGDETERTRFALELAAEGREVALISSGDPGIYAMATLAMELLDTGDLSDAARRVDVAVVPGVSAAQAAAARAGAPLGHDFAFISLSDLLTPWPAIARRLMAAAASDFVVALYNPRSRRRTEQLARALEIFRGSRPATTPVILAANVGRPAEAITVTTIADLDPEDVDMLSTVIIGASTTRAFTRGDGRTLVYTPRGYDKKNTL
ncbi:precorrin-3B C(17)-methyltransferase [Acuticoccus yangtzensis]|uniref:precorrin-3B C(17)-methyltransferase n=1 Tax=Acuticoccus yangtzensis TaxID=1443441 RepID=UPI000A850FCC|nr:precorrin-3B C(17)-methyltransferase [Acuticoccus yangtzensis]